MELDTSVTTYERARVVMVKGPGYQERAYDRLVRLGNMIEDGGVWGFRTREGAYQAQKPNCTEDVKAKLMTANGIWAKRYSRDAGLKFDSHEQAHAAMYKVLTAAAHENPQFRELLLSTSSDIVEVGTRDGCDYWGTRPTDQEHVAGRNILGKIMMLVRDECRKGVSKPMTQSGNKLIIAGSRGFNDYQHLEMVCDLFKTPFDAVVSGKAAGADKLGERWAKKRKIEVIEKPANWSDIEGKDPRYVRTRNNGGGQYYVLAGHERNEEMAKVGTHCLVFWDGVSTGTANMMKLAVQYKLHLAVVLYPFRGTLITPTVHNIRNEVFDTYIGRAHKGRSLAGSIWYNPFHMDSEEQRMQCIKQHRAYLMTKPDLIAKLPTLSGKRLGCWCKPQACHGDTLAFFVQQINKGYPIF